MTRAETDDAAMGAALVLARRGWGLTAPNPAVGCVIHDADGRLVGRGWTQPGGRPHAEPQALAMAGERVRGGTLYVTLEPCAHHGKTPPCADAIIAATPGRCVVAIEDPDPRTAGQGIARLRAAGIEVTVGVRAAEARAVTAGFLTRIVRGRPAMFLKTATTMDGRIATRTGASQWITGEAPRGFGHLLRAQADGVLAGIGTAIADDPRLNVRLKGLEGRSPVRIIADPRLRLPLTSHLARTARHQPVWLLARPDADRGRARAFQDLGAEIIETPVLPSGELDLAAACQALGARGLTRVLVEGGGRIAGALLKAGLIDRIHMLRAGLVIGGDGLPAVAGMGLEALADAPRFRLEHVRRIGEDLLETWVPSA